MDIYENQFRLFYQLLRHEGAYSQMHCQDIRTHKLVARELVNGEEEAVAWAAKYNGKGNVFIGRAPRTGSHSIEHTNCLSLDIDPERPKDSASTVEQHDESIRAGNTIIQLFHYGVLASSGNGALVLFPLRDPVNKEVAERWGRALEAKARELLTGVAVNVDSTWDIARLCKALGTISVKGDPSLWRPAQFIGDPHKPGSPDGFYTWLERVPQDAAQPISRILPQVSKGDLDRSKSDFALASRFRLQGLSPEDAYRALGEVSFRPGRDDDHRRIIEKVYGTPTTVVPGGSRREVILITPQSGFEQYKQRSAGGQPELPTGFASIDRATFGLVRGSIFTVGARTNTGKTTFAIGATLNLCRSGKRILYLSTETPFEEVWDRYIAVATGASAFALQHGIALNGHQRRVTDFIEEFQRSHALTVYDGSAPDLEVVKEAVEKAAPDVVVFDYFQHQSSRETKQLEAFVMGLHDLAKEKRFAVLMCAMLHDRFDMKTHKMVPPTLGDMKDCKVLNDESRVVILLDWDRDSDEAGPAAVKCLLAKNKGVKADCILRLDRSVPRFLEDA